jgi:hypothetical protein
VGTKSNRSAIGARVTCRTAGGRRQIQEVQSGGSYMSQSDLRLHFGLASSEEADIEVRWPDGTIENWPNLRANQVVKLVEGTSRPKTE